MANPVEQELPLVEAPHLAQAAAASQTFEAQLMTPRELGLSHFAELGVTKKMSAADMQVRERAYWGANWVLFLHKSNQAISELVASESKELMDAATRTSPPDGTLPARRLALTFLSRGQTGLGGPDLLNVASHLSHEIGFGCSECSARTCRFTFLAGSDAEAFLRIRRDALPEASRRVELIPPASGVGTVSVAVSWAIRMSSQVVLHTRVAHLPMPSRSNVADLCDAVVSAVSDICSGHNVLLTPGLASNRNGPSTTSFVEHQKKVFSDFQALLLPEPMVTLSEHVNETKAALDFSHDYVRICSRCYSIDHYSASFGLLLHEKGKAEQTKAFLRGLRDAEPSAVFGLRPPQGSYEEQLGLHVLSATAESLPLGTSVSSYSIEMHPGARLDVRNGCSVWKITRCIAPVEMWLARDSFVLPCSRDSAHPRAKELRLPLFELIENAVIATAKFFGTNGTVKKEAKELVKAERKAATVEDKFLATAFGLGLHVDAVRVGDVYDRVSEDAERCDGLCKLLLMAISKVGAHTSVTEALAWIADALPAQDSRVAALEQELHRLQIKDAMETDVREEPPAPPPAAQLDGKVFNKAIACLGLEKSAAGVTLGKAPKEDEADKLLTIACKAHGSKKKDLPAGTVEEAKAAHQGVDQDSLVARVQAIVVTVAGKLASQCVLAVADPGGVRLLRGDETLGLDALFAEVLPKIVYLNQSSGVAHFCAPRA